MTLTKHTTMRNNIKVLGIDPGYARLGWGVVQKMGSDFIMVAHGCIETRAHDIHANRLMTIHRSLKDVITEHGPDRVGVEEIFFAKNAKTAGKVGEARGVVLLTLIQSGLSIFEYTPLQIKQAITGYGRADKQQMQRMIKTILRLDSIPKPDDAADALAVAVTCLQSERL